MDTQFTFQNEYFSLAVDFEPGNICSYKNARRQLLSIAVSEEWT